MDFDFAPGIPANAAVPYLPETVYAPGDASGNAPHDGSVLVRGDKIRGGSALTANIDIKPFRGLILRKRSGFWKIAPYGGFIFVAEAIFVVETTISP